MSARNKEYLELLEHSFNEEKFIKFVIDLLNLDIGSLNRNITEKSITQNQYKDSIDYYKIVANYNDGMNNIGVFIFKLNDTSSTRARNMQRNFVATLLHNYSLDGALVSFFSDKEKTWRLSFVKKELSFTEKGVKESLTSAKRYSYLVGEGESIHTAKEYLLHLLDIDDRKITISDIEKQFDVEKVTKKFFEEYKEKYLQLKEFLDSNEDFQTEALNCDFDSEEFAKKLMGQIVFLYFLQKKGWLGVQLIPNELSIEDYNELLLNNDSVSQNLIKSYYVLSDNKYIVEKTKLRVQEEQEDIINLSNIFGGTKFDMPWGTGRKDFIRYIFNQAKIEHRNFFDDYLEYFFYKGLNKKRDNQYFALFNCKIPFLNGGLFEPLNNYRWTSAHFEIRNDIFSNDNKDGILDFLDLYNFTIDEEEPLEKDIAVDPEMLGKIFENLLDVDERSSKGAFYTPREIVYYMCQECLANYIVKKNPNVVYDEIVKFIRNGDVIAQYDWNLSCNGNTDFEIGQSVFDSVIEIDKSLFEVKIADPSVGSGAFPLGMLNEIVKLRTNLQYYFLIKKELGLIDFESLYGTQHFETDIYNMKLQIIENSIYAVDLENSAVDIAKLRLWLSLIVDYPNDLEPQPLPNLDCKIMQGNSLIDEFEGVPLFSDKLLKKSLSANSINVQQNLFNYVSDIHVQQSLFDDNKTYDELMNSLLDLQKKYFKVSDVKIKKEYKEKIDIIQKELIEESLKNDKIKLAKFKVEFLKRKKQWFLWKLDFYDVFKENNGFDIVIGNPPYVGEDGNKKIFDPIKKSSLGKRFYQGKMDLLYFFFHLGLDLANDNGIISFITTNYYITADGAKNLREDLKKRSNIKTIINFNEKKVFDSAKGQHNMITLLSKGKHKEDEMCNIITFRNPGNLFNDDLRNMLNDNYSDDDYVKKSISNKLIYYGNNNYLDIRNNYSSDSIESKIISSLGKSKTKLSDVAKLFQGVVPGAIKTTNNLIDQVNDSSVKIGDGIFVLDEDNVSDLSFLKSLPNEEKEILKPYFKNSDISKFYCNTKTKKWLIYTTSQGIDVIKYPTIYNHLKKFEKILKDRLVRYNESYHWTSLHRERDNSIFVSKKIVIPYRSKSNDFAYCDCSWYFSTDCYCLISDEQNLKYLLGLLNSKTYYIWFKTMGKIKGDVLEFMPTMLNETPIIQMNDVDKNRIIELVDIILKNPVDNIKESNEFKEIEKIIENYIK